MASSTTNDEARSRRALDNDDDDTLTEVGEERDFGDADEETDAIDRRRDPLRMPH